MKRIHPLLTALLLLPACGSKTTGASSAGTAGTAGTGGATGTASATSTSAGATTLTTSTTTGGASGSTGCDLSDESTWDPGATGTAGWVGYDGPYHPCQTDQDCADGSNLKECVAAKCLLIPGQGSICLPVVEMCLDGGRSVGVCPDPGPAWPDCSEADKSKPEYVTCVTEAGGGFECSEQDVCFTDCGPPEVPCPEGLICYQPDGPELSGYCLWPE